MIITEKHVVLRDGARLLLRSAIPSDSEAFLKHLIITGRESYRNLNRGAEHWERVSPDDQARFLEGIERSSNSFMMLAISVNTIVGGLGVFGMTHDFTVRNAMLGMSIQNEFGGRGLGGQMLEHALGEAKRIGLHRLELSVRTYNRAGIALYEKSGFERIGLLKDAAFIDGEYVNEYSYQKIL